MASIANLTKRLVKYQRKHAIKSAQGKVKSAGRWAAKIASVQFQIQKKQAKAGVTQLAVGGQVTQVATAQARLGIPGVPGRAKVYSVTLKKGSIQYLAPSGVVRTLGYTPATAKKKYKTRRRRPRLTKRDQAILMAISQNPQAAPALVMMK